MAARSLGEVTEAALARFGVLSGRRPDVIPTGIGPLDTKIGGMTPGMVGLMAIPRGVGKSSTALVAGYYSPVRAGILSLEDPEDELGLRLLSLKTGINGLDIRLSRLTSAQRKKIDRARDSLAGEDGLVLAFRIGATLRGMEDGIDELGEAGCRIIWVDYAQKPSGHREQRNIEVASTYTSAAARIAKWGAAGIVLSQITDSLDTKRPRMTQVRDSRDLINEARLVIMGWRDPDDPSIVHYSLDKSMIGGDGLRWCYRRDASGTLREMAEEDDFEGDF